MLTETINPRFNDTDALGHINNTTIPRWFEGARDPVFSWFTPDLDINHWKLMLAKIDVTFLGELFYQFPVEIRTYISRIGNSSFDVYQEAWQNDECRASGTAVMVHFDHQEKASLPIPDAVRDKMKQHAKPDTD